MYFLSLRYTRERFSDKPIFFYAQLLLDKVCLQHYKHVKILVFSEGRWRGRSEEGRKEGGGAHHASAHHGGDHQEQNNDRSATVPGQCPLHVYFLCGLLNLRDNSSIEIGPVH